MRAIIGTLGIAALLALSVIALQRGWSDILSFQGRSVLRPWDRQQRMPPADAWVLAHERLQQAHALDAANPNIAESIGSLYEFRASSRRQLDTAARADLGLALEYLRRTAHARPGSPYTWANIALVKLLLGQRDEEYLGAIRRAAAFGPWEPQVQVMLAEIGFRDWDRLPSATRTIVGSAMARGLKREDERLFALAFRHSRLDIFCTTPGVHRSKRAIRCI